MRWEIIAIGQKLPQWVDAGIQDYQKRFHHPYQLVINALPLLKRAKDADPSPIFKKESKSMATQIKSHAHVIALEVGGKPLSSEAMAKRLENIELLTSHCQFLIGGPEGLSTACSDTANEKWSLSSLTLTHPMARLFLVEALYRSWAINQNHPYHK